MSQKVAGGEDQWVRDGPVDTVKHLGDQCSGLLNICLV